MKRISKYMALILALVMALSLFGCKKEEPIQEIPTTTTTTTTTKAPDKFNPLTGEDDFDENALGVRPVAIVVENLEPARPQWGIETPDIIVEGEVEGGISRMLWIYADMKTVPDKIGPIRSARPPFIQFSELFDAIYIHWGGSHSKSGYIGGYETIRNDKVDHIDGMHGGKLFGRDTTRSTSSEHRGIVFGDKIPEVIKDKGFRTELNKEKYPKFKFNETDKTLGDKNGNLVRFSFSDRTDVRAFTYNEEKAKYVCSDWKTDVEFKNVIVLNTNSTYVTTPYKSSSTTYLNYDVLNTEGNGYYSSNGATTEINWSTKTGTLVLTDLNGNVLNLNKGNSYIGLCSKNHNGKIKYEV